jgi:Lysyl oxidase
MRLGRPRTAIAFLALAVLATLAWPSLASGAPSDPSVRLLSPADSATLHRFGKRIQLDGLPVWIAAVNDEFELRVSRADYDTPPEILQTDAASGAVIRDLPEDTLDGWAGLSRFFEVTVTDSDGAPVKHRFFTFCPNAWERQRVDDSGPDVPRYPTFCSDWLSFFTRGMVWGIDAGWASPAFAFSDSGVPTLRLPGGRYTFHIEIASSYAALLEVPAEDAEATLAVRIRDHRRQHHGEAHAVGRSGRSAERAKRLDVPIVTDPDPSTVPDLVALPLWGMTTFNRRGRDFVGFGATPWNAGPAPLVVEGFRRSGEAVMDAYQYFRDEEGKVVGRAPVGDFAWDTRRTHQHWHFQQFASFTLRDATNTEVIRSKKQSFCLAPTNAIDLSVERASWTTEATDVHTACGGESALWIREVLQVGWADTYYQGVPGQALEITDLPNGWYYARIDVNPLRALYEVTTDNNVESRRIYLGGRPGHRTVRARPWHGMDI